MSRRIFASRKAWLFGLWLVACGGRAVDSSEPGSGDTGGNAGSGATGGSATGGSGGSGGGSAGGSSGTTVGSGGTTVGSGGTTIGSGGTTIGSGGTTVGSGGTAVGSGGNSGGSSGAAGSIGTGGAAGAGGVGGAGAAGTDGGTNACYHCTRRPGPGVSLRCPAGIDQSTASVIGTAGGKISLYGQQALAELTIPPKAFADDVTVTITETSIPPPLAYSDWSPIYEVLPGGTVSASIMKLRLPWGNRDGLVPPITMYRAKDRNSPFTAVSDVYNNAGFSDAGITEFGLFFMGVLKTPEQMSCP